MALVWRGPMRPATRRLTFGSAIGRMPVLPCWLGGGLPLMVYEQGDERVEKSVFQRDDSRGSHGPHGKERWQGATPGC